MGQGEVQEDGRDLRETVVQGGGICWGRGDQEEGHPVGTGRVGYEGEAAITWSVAMFCPLLRSHTLAVSSRPPVASCLPSGLKATL